MIFAVTGISGCIPDNIKIRILIDPDILFINACPVK
jgi:hypothetical protein